MTAVLAAAAGIMLAGPDDSLRVMASSSEAMRVLELFEVQAQEGPCLDCHRTGQPVLNQDLDTAATRWPMFAPEALAAGFQSVQALPLRLRGTVIGALNLFDSDVSAMDQSDVELAQAFADIATISILQHRAARESQVINEQLNHALTSRTVIEQAKGMVAEREGLDMEQSFAMLRDHARNHNLRFAELAGEVINGTVTPSELDRLRPKSSLRPPGEPPRFCPLSWFAPGVLPVMGAVRVRFQQLRHRYFERG